MRSASLAGARHQRSAAQQIEDWASPGRELAAMLDPDGLLAVQAGLARLDRDGSCRVGRSVNGEFLACEVDAD